MALITNNISGSASGNSVIGVTGSLIFGNAPVLPAFPGNDVTFFVSGSTTGRANGRDVAVFGGDTVISGSLTIGTGSILISSNEIRFLGNTPGALNPVKIVSGSDGLTFFDSNNSSGVTLTSIVAGGGGGGDSAAQYLVLSATGSLSNERVFAPGTGLSATDGGAGNNYTIAINDAIVATVSGTTFTGDVTVNTNLTVGGNLTVNGTTTTIDTTNLLVKDPIILMASGTAGPNKKGGIAIFSGSSAGTDLVFGRVANDTWGAGALDTRNGTTSSLDEMSLVAMRANHFQVGGVFAAVTSSNGSNIILSGSVVEARAGDNGIRFVRHTDEFASFTSNVDPATPTLQAGSAKNLRVASGIGATTLTLSGSAVVANAGGAGLAVQRDGGTSFVTLTQVGTVANVLSPNSVLTVGATAGALVLSGATQVSVRHTGTSLVDFRSDNVPYLNIATGSVPTYANAAILSSSAGKALVLSGTSDLILGGGSAGGVAGYVAMIGTRGGRSGLFPATDRDTQQFDLGGPQHRWANIYTGDLHLRNERGDYTLIEEEDFLTIRFNKTGKRYKFVLEPVPEFDE